MLLPEALSRCFNDAVGGWIAVSQFAMLVNVYIGQRPSVFEGGSGCN